MKLFAPSTLVPLGRRVVFGLLLVAAACGSDPNSDGVPSPTPSVDSGVLSATPDAGDGLSTDAGLAVDAGEVVPPDSGAFEPVDAGPVGPVLTASISPSHGTAQTQFRLNLALTGFTLEAPGTVNADAGHYHYYFDGRTFRYTAGWSGMETFRQREVGEHTVTVYLVDGNHTTIVPPVAVTATFWVE